QHPARPYGSRRKPRLHADTSPVEISRLADADLVIDVDVGVAKHPLYEYRNCHELQGAEWQIGYIPASVELRHVKRATRSGQPAAGILAIDGCFQIDAFGPDLFRNQGSCTVIGAACHGQRQHEAAAP